MIDDPQTHSETVAHMKYVRKILGDRIMVRRRPAKTAIVIPHQADPDSRYEAEVVATGTRMTEEISPGDAVIIQRVGIQGNEPQHIMHRGEKLELVSTLDVAAVILKN